jgi:phage baseplate assembly protein W
MNIHFPLRYDHRGRTAECDDQEHIRELIDQVLFTSPFERVNRPDFGCGVRQLVFAPNGDQLAAALELDIQAALQRWLGHLIEVRNLEVSREESSLFIILAYAVLRTGEQRIETFEGRSAA